MIPVKTLFTGTYNSPDSNSDVIVLARSGRGDPTGSVMLMASPSDVKNLDGVFTNPGFGPNYTAANIGPMPVEYPITPDQSILDRSASLSPMTTMVSMEPLQRSGGLTDLAGLTTSAVVAQLPDRKDISNSTILAATSGNGHLKQGMITSATVLAIAPFTAPEVVSGPLRVGPYYSQKKGFRLFNLIDYNIGATPFSGGTVLTVPITFESQQSTLGVPNIYHGPVRVSGILNFDTSFLVTGANAEFTISVVVTAHYYRNDTNLVLQRRPALSEECSQYIHVTPTAPINRKFAIPIDTTLLNGFDEGETSCPGVLLGLSMTVNLGRPTNNSGVAAVVTTQILNSIQGSLDINYFDQKDTTNLNVGYISMTGGYKGAVNLRIERSYATRPDEKDITLFRDQTVYCMDQSRIDKLAHATWLITRSGSGLAFLGNEWRGYLALLSDSKTFYSLVRQAIEDPNKSLLDFRSVDGDETQALESIRANGLEGTLTPYQAMSPFWTNLLNMGKRAALAGLRAAVGSQYTATPRYGAMPRYGMGSKYNSMDKVDEASEKDGFDGLANPTDPQRVTLEAKGSTGKGDQKQVTLESKSSITLQMGDNKDTVQYCTINARIKGSRRSKYLSMDTPNELLTKMAGNLEQPSAVSDLELLQVAPNVEPIVVTYHPPGSGYRLPTSEDSKSAYKAMNRGRLASLLPTQLEEGGFASDNDGDDADPEEEDEEEGQEQPAAQRQPEEDRKVLEPQPEAEVAPAPSIQELEPIKFRTLRAQKEETHLKVSDSHFVSFAQIGHTRNYFPNKSWLIKTQQDNASTNLPRQAWFGMSLPVSTAFFPLAVNANTVDEKGRANWDLVIFQIGFSFMPKVDATYQVHKFDQDTRSTKLTLHVDDMFHDTKAVAALVYDYHMAANGRVHSRWNVFSDGSADVFISIDTLSSERVSRSLSGNSYQTALICALTGMPPVTNLSGGAYVFHDTVRFTPSEVRHKISGLSGIDYKLTPEEKWTKQAILESIPILVVEDEGEPELMALCQTSYKLGAPSGHHTIAHFADLQGLVEYFATYERVLG